MSAVWGGGEEGEAGGVNDVSFGPLLWEQNIPALSSFTS